MTVRQWGMRIPARQGEEMRQALLREGALDASKKVLRDGGNLILPLTGPREGAEEFIFEAHPGRGELPRHELVGGIAILQEEDSEGAEKILSARPSLHTAVFAKGEVSGEYRTREFTILAGTPTTRTEVVEHGHRFSVDLAGAYFSARLSTERQRIARQVRGGEVILDMFAGVGPFAIALAGAAGFVVAADINPRAVLLMMENVRKNRVHNVLPVLGDARRLGSVLPWRFDRVVMNLPLAGMEFLPGAFPLTKPGGIIHLYSLVSTREEHAAQIHELGGEILAERIVRSYSPAQWHAVYDIEVTGT